MLDNLEDCWTLVNPESPTQPANNLFINHRNLLRRHFPKSEREHGLTLAKRLPKGTCYDADYEDPKLDARCTNALCLCNARFRSRNYCGNSACEICPSADPPALGHYCSRPQGPHCSEDVHVAPLPDVLPFPAIRLRPYGVFRAVPLPDLTVYCSAQPNKQRKDGTCVSRTETRTGNVIGNYPDPNPPLPVIPEPAWVTTRAPQKIVEWWEWSGQLTTEQKRKMWHEQLRAEKAAQKAGARQKEWDEMSTATCPPTDIDDFDDCYNVFPAEIHETPAFRKYINAKNSVIKHVWDVERTIPVSSCPDGGEYEAGCEGDSLSTGDDSMPVWMSALDTASSDSSSAIETLPITPDPPQPDDFDEFFTVTCNAPDFSSFAEKPPLVRSRAFRRSSAGKSPR